MKRSWVEIDEARLKANYGVVCEAAGTSTDVLAVVKANAYGHGLERCAVALAHAGAKWLGVADAAEGARVREALTNARCAGVEILVMCGMLWDEARLIAEHGLTPVVWAREHVGSLAEVRKTNTEILDTRDARSRMTGEPGGAVSGRAGAVVRVHVEIETGMGRQGVRPGVELDALLRAVRDAGLELDGVCTHFASAEVAGAEKTREQRVRFEEAVAQVGELGMKPRRVHAGSSASVDLGMDLGMGVGGDAGWLEGLAKSVGARAMVRSGIALYGYCPMAAAAETETPCVNAVRGAAGGGARIRSKLKPVMTWKTRVLDVRAVAAGETIGYNATFTAKRAMRVALLPAGYADGLRRELSGTGVRAGGWVMVRGADGAMQRAAIVGRVSMNLTAVDVTGIEGVRAGDEVVLLGDGVTADDHARFAGTIAYEILCGVGGR
jgi:alanine racemase